MYLDNKYYTKIICDPQTYFYHPSRFVNASLNILSLSLSLSLSHFREFYGAASVAPRWFSIMSSLALK